MKRATHWIVYSMGLAAILTMTSSGVALAYPNNEADCKAAGGKWVEKDTPEGCMGFCFMRLSALLTDRGGGGPVGGAAHALDHTRDQLRDVLTDYKHGGTNIAGDVAVAVSDTAAIASAAATCSVDPKGAGGRDGQLVGVMHLNGSARLVVKGGTLSPGATYQLRLVLQNGVASAIAIDEGGSIVAQLPAVLTLDPSIKPEVPGGSPRAWFTDDGAVLEFQWSGARLRVLPTVNK